MSQYPSPYYPPNVQPPYMPYGGSSDLLAPAKRASVLMFILGPLLMMCGGCFISLPFMFFAVPPEKLQPMLDQLQNPYLSPKEMLIVLGSFVCLPGIALLVLGFFVRRGGRVAAILAAVVVALVLVRSVIELLLAMLHPTDANAISAFCMDGLTIGIFGLLFYWLIQTARQSSGVAAAQQQYMAQYYQYQQNMQAYAAYGYASQPQVGQGYAPPAISPQPPPLIPPTEVPTPPPNGG